MAQPPKIREPELDPDLFDIRHVIDVGLQTKRDHKGPRTSSGWTAGNLGYCLRRQWFDRAEVPVEPDYPLRTFWVGDTLHDAFKQQMRNAGLLIQDELHLVDEELDITGYVDMIWGGLVPDFLNESEQDFNPWWQDVLMDYRRRLIELWPQGFPITGDEVKTANDFSARKMQSEGPQVTHKFQVGTYALILKRHPELFEAQVDRWQLSVLDKSDGLMLVFPIRDSVVDETFDRVSELNELWKTRVMPPCTCVGFWQSYCRYKDDSGCCDPHLVEKATSEEFWNGVPDAASTEG